MSHALELAYLGVEVAEPEAFDKFLGDIVGLVPGEGGGRPEGALENGVVGGESREGTRCWVCTC